MISVKKLAKELGVSTQAIYKYFKQYPELKEHKIGTELDEYAEQFIRTKSNPDPVIVIDQKNIERIKELEELYTKQLEKNQELMERLFQLQEVTTQQMLELKDKELLKIECDQLKKENEKYIPTLFGLYKKKKD